MANNVVPGMAVTYVRSTGEHASATIIGPSCHGDKYINLKYMRNGTEIEHNAAFDKVLFPIRSPSPSHLRAPPHVGAHCRAVQTCASTCRKTCSKASSEGLTYPIVRDEAEGWKGFLFHGTRCPTVNKDKQNIWTVACALYYALCKVQGLHMLCCPVCCEHAQPCLSKGWALNRHFDLTFGTTAVLAQAGGGGVHPDGLCFLGAHTQSLSGVLESHAGKLSGKHATPGDIWGTETSPLGGVHDLRFLQCC